MKLYGILSIVVQTFLLINSASAQSLSAYRLFEQNCLMCHGNTDTNHRIPHFSTLHQMTSEYIYQSLTTGTMAVHAQTLTESEKRLVAEYIGGRNIASSRDVKTKQIPNMCMDDNPINNLADAPLWNGWGADVTNSRFQEMPMAGLLADQISQLKLKWAFGFPDATMAYGQPTIAVGRIFIGVNTGHVYSLDMDSGCPYWTFRAQAGVRTAISIGEYEPGKYAVYFGDIRANVYAVNATTGELIWKTKVDEHALASITGAPTIFDKRLYVPVSSREEVAGVNLNYPCCTFRGSIVALDANSGKQIWKTYIITQPPKPTRKNSIGTQLWAPAGGAIWNSPTIDVKHGTLYIGTGNSYTEPAADTTDAVMAIDMDTGEIRWVVQNTADDAWLLCFRPFTKTENCPKQLGPDYDFGASPILRNLDNGQRILVAGQKSGMVFAHDPDRQGTIMWKTPLVENLSQGEITFGGAADEKHVYFGLKSGGIAAIELSTGKQKWFATLTGGQNRAGGGQTAALTLIPGVIFSGGWDGVLRALSTDDGSLLWQFNTMREFKTVNNVPARGGSMGASGPTIAGGMLFIGSGYTFGPAGNPGNILLAFSIK